MRRKSSRFARAFVTSTCLLMGLLLSDSMEAKGAAPSPPESIDLKAKEWESILAKRGLNASKDEIALLVFDHAASTWSVFHYSSKGCVERQDDPLGPDGNPLVLRGGKEKLLILITNTNPFLYAYEGVVQPPQDSPDAAALRTLASALGSASAGVIHAAAGAPRVRAIDVKHTQEALKRIADAIRSADDHRLEARTFAQAVEFGRSDAPPDDLTPASIAADKEKVIGALKDARRLRSELNPDGPPASCLQPWAGFFALLGTPGLDEVPAIGDKDLEAVRNDLLKAAAWGTPECIASLGQERQSIEGLAAVAGAERSKKAKSIRDDPTTSLLRITYALDQVMAKERDIFASLSVNEGFSRIAGDYLGVADGKYQVLTRSTIAVLAPPFPAQTWLKDNPGTLSIKPEGAVCNDCTRIKPTAVDKKFLLASRRQNVLGIGFGVVYTTIKDPTFGAVHVDKDNQVIGRTSEDSRSGAIVVMGSLRLLSALSPNSKAHWIEPCLDLGAGLDAKKPSLYLGGSVEFLRYFRLGFGETWQVINRLDDGLQEAQYGPDGLPIAKSGTTVFASSDIRTRNTTTARPYISLTFALDALPFFQPK